jgi:UPF0716 protein FxsA
MWLLAAFVALPIIEIALFIWVGGLIGVLATLLLVVASAVLGMAMLRSQGFAQLQRLQASFEGRGDPAAPLAHGAMILLSGILLIIPGFFTDALGLALLIPGVRNLVYGRLRRRMNVTAVNIGGMQGGFQGGFQTGAQGGFGDPRGRPESGQGVVIDGEFEEVDPDTLPSQPGSRPSGWTRH